MERNLSFDAAALTEIEVRLAWAQVEIFADDVEKVQVLAAGDENTIRDIKIETEESKLVVEQPQYGLSLNLTDSRWMQVCIRVPRAWKRDMRISTIGGLLSARGLQGKTVQMDTVSGDLRAARIQAEALSIKSISGDVRGDELSAPRLTFRTVGGDVTLDHARTDSLRGTTVSGEQIIHLTDSCAHCELRSVSGDVMLTSPMERINLNMRSVSGRVSTEGVSLCEDVGAPSMRVTGVSADIKLIALH